jgi:hypothetical protein
MRRIFIATATALGVFAAVGLPTAGAAPKAKGQHITRTLLGGAVSANENVYDVRGPGGYSGAAVQFVKLNSTATAGTDRVTLFDGKGAILSTDKFTLGKPDANGIVTVTGTGHSVSGTGIYKHVKETYSFTGTVNTKNGQSKFTLSGTLAL